MSRAGGEPRPGDDFPPLPVASLTVREADPSPERGPSRDALAGLAEKRVTANEDAVLAVVDDYLDRLIGVTLARLQGPRARKNTRWWAERVTPEEKRGGVGGVATYTATIEVKALDAEYVLPPKTAREIADPMRAVGISIVTTSIADTSRRLGRPNVGLALFDQQAVDKAVEDAVRRMLGVADRHAAEIRDAITRADSTAQDLDDVLDRVREAHRRGGNWVRLAGRNLAIALGNDASLAAARALGVTHVQWLSKRDERVRATHRIADGQVRRTGERFKVGNFGLRYPADPTNLPESWGEVAGCRCGLLFMPVDQDKADIMRAARKGTARPARQVLRDAAVLGSAAAVGDEAAVIPTPHDPGLPGFVPALPLPSTLVGYRLLDEALEVTSGQWLGLRGPLAFGLAAPAVGAAELLVTVVVPAGYTVGVGAGSLVLPTGTVLEVVSVTSTGVVVSAVA